MWKDPIVDEIRRIRETHAARFNYDLQEIYRDLKKQKKNSKRTFVSYSARNLRSDVKATKTRNKE